MTYTVTGPELEHVPTVAELVMKGEARVAHQSRGGTQYTLTAKGQQMIYDAMARNAKAGREYDEQHRRKS